MSIIKLSSVPLIPQPTDGVCWYVSARMLYKWQTATGRGTMTDPASDSGMKYRFDNNLNWDAENNGWLGGTLSMKRPEVSLDFEGVNAVLQQSGPIWAAGWKTWGNKGYSYGHVVVIVGVADTGVLIHDPEPMKKGTVKWLTWAGIKKYIYDMTDADVNFLTAA